MQAAITRRRRARRRRTERNPCIQAIQPEELSDEALMERFRDGDSTAFESLYRRHRGPLYRFILRSVNHDTAIAEELFQDTWTRLIDARRRYRVRARFTTYLYRIAQNRVIDHHRSSRPQEAFDDNESGYASTSAREEPPSVPDRDAAARALRRAIAELPLEQRTAFLLRAEQDLSLEEIAAISGVGRETVKSRLRYAMNKLRDALGGNYERAV